ncbi:MULTISPECIES: Pr6Pr family membrane protein [Microbacterium]|uniref:Pr6Pr family membrane protein n=1 Tax=Microbacterium TaxID=33882 RepID=UPI00300FBACC
MRARTVVALVRVATAAVCLVALVHRLFWGLSSRTAAGENFFAYLTVQSNIALMLLLVVAAALALRRAEDPRWLSAAYALVLTWTLTAGLAFGLIVWQAHLRGIPMTVPWSDQLIHYWLPAFSASAWLVTPARRPVPWTIVPASLAFPLVWGGFTMWRGPIIGWYPYYFLDPRQVSGPAEFLGTSAVALAIFAAVSSVLVLTSRLPGVRWSRPGPGS